MTSLNRLVRLTVAYYDVLGVPLTSFEAWEHLIDPDGGLSDGSTKRYSLGEVRRVLVDEVEAGRLIRSRGFYFLPGRVGFAERRVANDQAATARLKRVRRLVSILRFVPFLRMIGVTGSLSIGHCGRESDWDLFIILRSGFIFTGRTVVTGFLHLIGKRRHGSKTRNRACLNYFVTESGLEIGSKDLFAAHEYRFLIPFFGYRMSRRFERSNAWIGRYKPNMRFTETPPLWIVRDTPFTAAVRRFGEAILAHRSLERLLARLERRRILRNPKTSLPGSLIEAGDCALVFLPEPRGPKVFEQWKRRAGEYAILP